MTVFQPDTKTIHFSETAGGEENEQTTNLGNR